MALLVALRCCSVNEQVTEHLSCLQSHGFARNTAFQLLDATADSATLSLRPPKDAPADWPPAFELQVTVGF